MTRFAAIKTDRAPPTDKTPHAALEQPPPQLSVRTFESALSGEASRQAAGPDAGAVADTFRR